MACRVKIERNTVIMRLENVREGERDRIYEAFSLNNRARALNLGVGLLASDAFV